MGIAQAIIAVFQAIPVIWEIIKELRAKGDDPKAWVKETHEAFKEAKSDDPKARYNSARRVRKLIKRLR